MALTIEHLETKRPVSTRDSKSVKLASTVIWGTGCCPLDDKVIHQLICNTIGVFYSVDVQVEPGNQVRIEIHSEDEVLEEQGLMQISIFNLLSSLCKECSLQVKHIENEYLPDYA